MNGTGQCPLHQNTCMCDFTPHLGANDCHIQLHTDAHTGHLGSVWEQGGGTCQQMHLPKYAGIPLSKQFAQRIMNF